MLARRRLIGIDGLAGFAALSMAQATLPAIAVKTAATVDSLLADPADSDLMTVLTLLPAILLR